MSYNRFQFIHRKYKVKNNTLEIVAKCTQPSPKLTNNFILDVYNHEMIVNIFNQKLLRFLKSFIIIMNY